MTVLDIQLKHAYISLAQEQITGSLKARNIALDQGSEILLIEHCYFAEGYKRVVRYQHSNHLDWNVGADGWAIAPFCIYLPTSLRPSLNEPLNRIEYTIEAALSSVHVTYPIVLYQPAFVPSRKVFWGTTKTCGWRYEIDSPRTMVAQDELMVRVRSAWKTASTHPTSSLESCLVGYQLLETSTLHDPEHGQPETTRQVPLATLTRVLIQPSTSWQQPCRLPIHLDSLQPTVSSKSTHVQHHICLTLSFCTAHGQTDRVELRFPLTILAIPSSLQRRPSLEALATDSDGDSGVCLDCPSLKPSLE